MRVIAGKARGTKLLAPKHEGIRPTSDYIKENLFNIIQNDVMGCSFLDIFCGSGAVGIEALSRGAASATFIDNDKLSIALACQNLDKTKLKDEAVMLEGYALNALQKLSKQQFDIIFLDPPYFEGLVTETLQTILEMDILADMGYIIVEISKELPKQVLDDAIDLEIFKEKIYGSTKLIFLRKVQNDGNLPR